MSGGAAPERIVAQLEELGMTRNEGLAYLTLLQEGNGGSTGYEVAARSGIPRSAVYGVLRKLEQAGAAFAVGDHPARYLPTAPKTLVEHLGRQASTRLDRLRESLQSLPGRERPEPIWLLARYDEVVQRMDTLVRGARRSVWLSLWSREVELLRPAFEAIGPRALHRVLHTPDRVAEPPAGFSCWLGDISGDATKLEWSHKALVIVDREEALIGGTEPGADNKAVVTTNPSLVDVATNHVILDITLLASAQGRDCGRDVSLMMFPHLAPLQGGKPR